MKKLLVLFAVLFLVLTAQAQIGFGVKAGGNASFLSKATVKESGVDETLDASKMLIGFHGGVFGNYSFGEFFGVQAELLYSMQGGKYEDSFMGAGSNVSFKLGYINLPVMFEVKPITNFSILVGPQIGLMVGKKMTASINGVEVSIKGSDLKDMLEADDSKLNTIDFSAAIGVQYTIADHFILGARYNLGFTPFLKPTDSSIDLSGWNNNTIQISFGYKF